METSPPQDLSEMLAVVRQFDAPSDDLLLRLPTIAPKLHRRSRRWRSIATERYPDHLLAVEETTGDFISSSFPVFFPDVEIYICCRLPQSH